MVRYLSVTEFAEHAGLSRNTLKSYSQIPGRLPEPDAMVGRVKGWLPETVEAWIAKRA
ncbi:helix-turn-helix transcriptional regulator [Mycolicibacterium porcinum]|uniref:XRE family transcriptional regulator n=1 Tax=Mycolicibacterium porcinum TaxID=39693 RepID=A0ABV3VLS1_9MYCO